jgi:hypothetical protein
MTATAADKALYRAFLACLIVVSLPIKNFAYVAPAIYLLIMWLHGEYGIVRRVALLGSAIVTISLFAIYWDHLGGRTVNFAGLWFGLITYAPLAILLCETFDRNIDGPAYDRYVAVCAWFILFQSFIGVLQLLATRNPDAVCGTFGLLDGSQQQITIAQVYFTFTIIGMILFVVPAANGWLPRVAIAVGALVCVLAQSGHQIIFLVLALLVCGLRRITHFGTLVRTFAAAAVLAFLVLQIYPDTIWLAREWYEKVTDTSQSPKWLALEGAASVMEEPKNLLFGTGLGQYSSRAALISSDEYLNVKLPGFLTGRSEYFDRYIRPPIALFEEIGESSAIAKPYMSVMSLPVELGLLLTILLIAAICHSVVWCTRVMAGEDEQLRRIGFTMLVGVLFFVLCCFIENYAEFSQAVFAPFLLFIVAGSRAQTMVRAAEFDRSRNGNRVRALSRSSYGLAAPRPLR